MEKKRLDIANREDIKLLINAFYARVRTNPVLSAHFGEGAGIDWNKHLPVMYDFWENVLFHTGKYEGNPMARHDQVHARNPMKIAHFNTWLQLFCQTVDELFQGPNATNIKERAQNIATVMQVKLFGHR